MAGIFDNTGINQSQQIPSTSRQGTSPGRGVLFGRPDRVSTQVSDGTQGTTQGQGIIFSNTDVVTTQTEEAFRGTTTSEGTIFGRQAVIDEVAVEQGADGSPGPAGRGVTSITRDDATGVITVLYTDNTTDTFTIPGGGSTVTYDDATDTLTIDGVAHILMTGSEDTRTALERFRTAINDSDTRRDFIFDNNLPQTITFTLPGNLGTVLATFTFTGTTLNRVVYTGDFVNTLLGGTNGEFIKTFDFIGTTLQDIVWTEAFLSLTLELSLNGLLTRTEGTTAEASLTENGLLTVPGGEYTLTENGLLQEMA